MGRRDRARRRKKGKANNVSCSPVLISLCQWLSAQGWVHSQPLSPAVFPDTGRGLQARAHIAPGVVLVSVPHSAIVTPTTVTQSYLGKQIETLYGNSCHLSAQELLSLWLVSEQSKGCSSVYFAYLQSLPSTYTVPYFCSPSEISSLPEYLRQLIENQIQMVTNSFNKVIKLKNDIATLSSIDKDSFAWAWFTVNTRAVFHKQKVKVSPSTNSCDCIALAPYLDLFNHHPGVSVKAGEGLDSRVGKRGDYQIITKNAINKYDEVFINYGPHSNTKLFLEYGFFPPHNPHESFPISPADLSSYCHQRKPPPLHLDEKMSLLSDQKLSHNVNISTEGLSWNGKACLGVLLMSKLELKNWFAVYDTAESDDVNKEAQMFVNFVYNRLTPKELQSEVEVTPSFLLANQLVLSHQRILSLALHRNIKNA